MPTFDDSAFNVLFEKAEKSLDILIGSVTDLHIPNVLDLQTKTQRGIREANSTLQMFHILKKNRERLAELELKITDAKISLIQYERSLHNALSDVDGLPDEILDEIFGHLARGVLIAGDRLSVVADVCSRWRRVVLGNSSLWSRLDLRWPSGKIELWGRRSRDHTLTMKLRHEVPNAWEEICVEKALAVVDRLSLLSRTVNLDLSFSGRRRDCANLVYGVLASFRKLRQSPLATLSACYRAYDYPSRHPHLTFPAILPSSLQSLHLSSFDLESPILPNLKTLSMARIELSFESWTAIFNSSPTLENILLRSVFVLGEPGEWLDRDDSSFTTRSYWRHLKTLFLEAAGLTFFDLFARHSEAPVLHSLTVVAISPPLMSGLLHNLRSIKSLTIGYPPRSASYINPRMSVQSALEAISTEGLLDLDVVCDQNSPGEVEDEIEKFINSRFTNRNLFDGKALRNLTFRCGAEGREQWFRERVHHLKLFK